MSVLPGGVDQQSHPGLLAVRVWMTLGGAFVCNMPLFETFTAGMRSVVVGKLFELRRMSLGFEGSHV
jgi:hypothetical protein